MAVESEGIQRRGGSRRSWGGLVLVQCVCLLALAATSALTVRMGWGMQPVAAAVLVSIVVFLVFWPLRGTVVDRVLSFVVGVLAVGFAATSLGDLTFYPRLTSREMSLGGLNVAMYPYARWASAFVILLVAITIVGFARQMAREERSHLVRSLSHSMLSAVACASAAGWTFLPRMLSQWRGRPGSAAILCIVIGLGFVLALIVASYLWWREEDSDPSVRAPWVGFALLPVLLSGLVAYGCSLALTLLMA